MKLAVIGDPVAHSLSPNIHNYWLKKYKIDDEYERIKILSAELTEKFSQLKQQNFKGLNVTIPHKEAIISLVDDLSDSAKYIGAVNTVVFRDGKTYGHNTDADGFYLMLPENIRAGNSLVILGAGGAARAVLYALKNSFKKITIVNRDKERAEKLAHDIAPHSEICGWDNVDLSSCDLLVNTTSLGMSGKEELTLSLDNLPKNAAVADIVYVPRETELLKKAAARGNTAVGGIGMLLHQAALAFELWYGIRPEIDDGLLALL